MSKKRKQKKGLTGVSFFVLSYVKHFVYTGLLQQVTQLLSVQLHVCDPHRGLHTVIIVLFLFQQ